MTISSQDARALQAALRETAIIAAQQAAAIKATLPQLYSLDQLEVRYGGMGRCDLKNLLRACGVWPENTAQGRTIRIPLDHVLLVDAVVNRRIDAARIPSQPGVAHA